MNGANPTCRRRIAQPMATWNSATRCLQAPVCLARHLQLQRAFLHGKRRSWAAEQVTLERLVAQAGERPMLSFGFDALGDDRQSQTLTEGQHGAGDRCVV